jgi:hypothetical protein
MCPISTGIAKLLANFLLTSCTLPAKKKMGYRRLTPENLPLMLAARTRSFMLSSSVTFVEPNSESAFVSGPLIRSISSYGM